MGISKWIKAIFNETTPEKQRKPRGAGEIDPGVGKVYSIDYDNGYNTYTGRKIRVLFVIKKRHRYIIRAYCFYSTRQRWFEVSEIKRVADPKSCSTLSNDAVKFFENVDKFDTR